MMVPLESLGEFRMSVRLCVRVRARACVRARVRVRAVVSNPVDYSCAPGSSVRGIFQARILEWVAILFSRGPSRPRD